jgi:hypothetical protein
VTNRGISRSFHQSFCLPNDRPGRAEKRNRSNYVTAAPNRARRHRVETSVATGFDLWRDDENQAANASARGSFLDPDVTSASTGRARFERPSADASAWSACGHYSENRGTEPCAGAGPSSGSNKCTASDNEIINGHD